MWQYNGTTIRVGRSWTDDNGVTHPSVWNRWTPEFKTSIGLVWVEPPAPPDPYDERFYWSANNPKSLDDVNVTDEDGNPVLDMDGNQQVQQGLKSQWIERTKTTAGGLLSATDWYVVRKAETSTAVPQAVLDYRASVRTASNSIESAINGCTTLQEFMALFTVPTDAEGNPTGKSVINGWPNALTN
jgi:hypothetical protein